VKPYSVLDLGKREVVINGHTEIATLEARLYHDDAFTIDWECEPGEKEKLEDKINSGELTPTFIEVVATSPTCEEGGGLLRGCLVSDETDARNTLLENDMINTALDSLVSDTIARAAELERFTRPA